MSESGVVREATLDDLPALVCLERKGFPIDQFSREQLEHFLTRAHATTLVIDIQGTVRGSAIMLWRRASRTGHLYSITTDPDVQGRGLGGRLLAACEEAARNRGCTTVALESRPDNEPALAMYRKRGYQPGGTVPNYYSDGAPALQMSKPLAAAQPPSVHRDVPFHRQGLGFTSGPACLMMAMKHFSPELRLDRSLEIALWREASSVFITTGIGGCGPLGLAVSAARRGYPSRVVTSRRGPPFLTTLRNPQRREIARAFHEDLQRQAQTLKLPSAFYRFEVEDIEGALRDDRVPILLAKGPDARPRWVAVTGLDASHVFSHDPAQPGRGETARRQTRVSVDQFHDLTDCGRGLGRCLVLVGRPPVVNSPG